MLDDRSKGVYNLNQPSTYLKMAEGVGFEPTNPVRG